MFVLIKQISIDNVGNKNIILLLWVHLIPGRVARQIKTHQFYFWQRGHRWITWLSSLVWNPGQCWDITLNNIKYIKEELTCKKALILLCCSEQSFLQAAYCKVAAAILLNDGPWLWAESALAFPTSGLVVSPSLSLLPQPWVLLPNVGSGGGLDLSIASIKACLAAEVNIMAPSLWSRWQHWVGWAVRAPGEPADKVDVIVEIIFEQLGKDAPL